MVNRKYHRGREVLSGWKVLISAFLMLLFWFLIFFCPCFCSLVYFNKAQKILLINIVEMLFKFVKMKLQRISDLGTLNKYFSKCTEIFILRFINSTYLQVLVCRKGFYFDMYMRICCPLVDIKMCLISLSHWNSVIVGKLVEPFAVGPWGERVFWC